MQTPGGGLALALAFAFALLAPAASAVQLHGAGAGAGATAGAASGAGAGAGADGEEGLRLVMKPDAGQKDKQQELVAAPQLVVPGDWLSDKGEKFLFLPMAIPEGISLQQCKVLSNGGSLLVVVTEQPQDEPESDALRKYKLVVDALKSEVGHDEGKLKEKLEDWLDTEEDEEVRVRVKAAVDSLSNIRAAKHDTSPRTVAVPLGVPALFQQAMDPSSVMQLRGSMSNATKAPRRAGALPASAALRTLVAQGGRGKRVRRKEGAAGKGTAQTGAGSSHTAAIIKESFTIDIPYPVPPEQVFAVLLNKGKLIVGMPWLRSTLEAKGVSTGGKPFARVPVFDMEGKHLAGPTGSLTSMMRGSDVHFLAAKAIGPRLIPLGQ